MRQLDTLPASFRTFDRLCGPASGPVGVAVSGGSDSLALLHLSRDWAEARGRDLLALTFDHGLRPASAGEAARVAETCEALGVPHETLHWAAPVARQSAARRARHAALALALKAAGGSVLLMGHTADDQAETFLMRARQGSTWYGLAGIQPLSLSPAWPEGEGIRIARPLLAMRRADLRDMLAARGQVWIDDPSNRDRKYERVRMRELLAASPGIAARVTRCLQDFAALRAIEDALIGRWLRDRVRLRDDGRIEADLDGLTPERAGRGLGLLIQVTAGREAPPRQENLRPLAERLCADRPFAGATLGGVKLERKGRIAVLGPEKALDGPQGLGFRRLGALRDILIGRP